MGRAAGSDTRHAGVAAKYPLKLADFGQIAQSRQTLGVGLPPRRRVERRGDAHSSCNHSPSVAQLLNRLVIVLLPDFDVTFQTQTRAFYLLKV